MRIAYRQRPSWREPRIAQEARTLGLVFDCLGVDGSGSRSNAVADDYGGFRGREWRVAIQTARGAGDAARRSDSAARWPLVARGTKASHTPRNGGDLTKVDGRGDPPRDPPGRRPG